MTTPEALPLTAAELADIETMLSPANYGRLSAARIKATIAAEKARADHNDAGWNTALGIAAKYLACAEKAEADNATLSAKLAVMLEIAQGFDDDDRDYERINNLADCENNHWRTQLRLAKADLPQSAADLIERIKLMDTWIACSGIPNPPQS